MSRRPATSQAFGEDLARSRGAAGFFGGRGGGGRRVQRCRRESGTPGRRPGRRSPRAALALSLGALLCSAAAVANAASADANLSTLSLKDGHGTTVAYAPVLNAGATGDTLTTTTNRVPMASPDALINNLDESDDAGIRVGARGDSSTVEAIQAIQFETGGNDRGYNITYVKAVLADATASDGVRVGIFGARTNGTPFYSLYTLSNPAIADGTLTFTAPASATLAKDTSYFLVFDSTAAGAGNHYEVRGTESDALNSVAAGWSLSADRRAGKRDSLYWTTESAVPLIEISGDAVVQATDATLSALSISHGDGQSPTGFSPRFDSSMTSYTSSASALIDRITLQGTAGNADGATLAYLDGDDQPLTDADAEQEGFQVDLEVGENTIRIRVTAENGSTTRTYTLVVTRDEPLASPDALLSNLDEPNIKSIIAGWHTDLQATGTHAVGFETGGNEAGYVLTSAKAILSYITHSAGVRARIFSSTASGDPHESLYTLSSATNAVGVRTFEAPAGATLENDTRYFLVLDTRTPQVGKYYKIRGTMSESVNRAAAGWSLNPDRHVRVGDKDWKTSDPVLLIEINGEAVVRSSDATLSSLLLTWDDAGTETDVTLDPAFEAATTAYTVSVANGVGRITVDGTGSHSGATPAYFDGADSALTDADGNATGFQVDLGVGENTIKVQVTAEDGSTIRTYVVTVTRAAPAWTTTLTVGDDGGRGFSSLPNPDVGSLENVSFEHAGATHQIQIVAATPDGVTFKTRSGGDTFGGLVLEWGGAVLPLDDGVHGRYNTFTWDQTWLDANAPSLNAANYETTLPAGGSETVCLRAGSGACPPTPVFEDGASASRTVAENAPAGTAVGAAVEATDTAGNSLAYSLAGANATEFAIDESTGQLTTAAVLDHEAGPSRSVTVSAADPNGGATSIPVTVAVTNVAEPPDAPSAPTVSGSSSTSLSVSWSAPASAGRPEVTDYDVRYRFTGGAYADWAHTGAATEATITGLSADTLYEVQVLARNADGASGWSATGEGRTEAEAALTAWFEGAPDAHDGASEFTLTLKFSDRVSTLVRTLRNDRLTATNGTVTGMRRVDRTAEGAAEFTLRVTPTGREALTVSLPADGTACDAGGVCTAEGVQLSEGASASVAGPAPEAPDAPSAPGLTAGTTWIEASWTAPADNGSAITDYDLHYRESGGNWTDANHAGTGTTKRIDGLAAGTDYEVRVRASNAEGTGDWSPASSGRTTADDVAAEGDVRLVNGSTVQEGRVEIHHGGEWGTVCDDRFASDDAEVVCRQLGYTGGEAHGRAAFGAGTGTIWMDDVQCTGSESRLADCAFAGWGIENCRHSEDVGVSCGAASGMSLTRATVSGSLVTLRFERPLDGGSVPAPGDFVVAAGAAANAVAIPIESVAVVDGGAELSLSRGVRPSENVSVSYLPAAMHPLQDTSFNPAPALGAQPVRHARAAGETADVGLLGEVPPTAPVPLAGTGGWSPAKIEVLDLSKRGLDNLSALSGLADVEVLDLGGNRIADLSPLAAMVGLDRLDLSGNAVADLSALGALPHLRVLDLSNNAVTDVSPLAALTALRRLDLSGNRVTDLRPLSELRGLEVLLLGGNEVSNLVPLWGLTDLAHLGLGHNRIADAALLRELRALRRLDLSGNRLRDVSALGDMPQLVWLHLAGNPIADLSPLGRLTAVRWPRRQP